jgi:acetolactate synthase-1/2/3 large subunit
MTGAECLLRTLLANGVDLCLMNPGTSEMQFVSALDRVPAMRAVLGLFEGVCSGAADGYARMAGKPAATLLHLGPGLANALSNLHNARKARSPVVNIVGEHSTQHLAFDAPLTADIEAFARPVSAWVRTLESPTAMGETASAAVGAAITPPGRIATLIVPADFSWNEAGEPGCPAPRRPLPVPGVDQIRAAAEALRDPETALLIGGRGLQLRGLRAAERLRAATGVRIFGDRNTARMTRGCGVPAFDRIPYFPEQAQPLLAPYRRLVMVEAKPPVSFFGYPGVRSTLAAEGCSFTTLASLEEDGPNTLEALADEAGAPQLAATPPQHLPELPSLEPLTAAAIARVVAALAPEGAILSDETVSSSGEMWPHLAHAALHDHLPVTGGSIGQGLPVALGAALACPQRKVIALEADGSAMYTPQSLWTMARERLDVTVIILANRRYRILDIEMRRTGAPPPGPRANQMLDLANPVPDWIRIAEGLGVPASRAETTPAFIDQFREAMRQRGPCLIEAVLA